MMQHLKTRFASSLVLGAAMAVMAGSVLYAGPARAQSEIPPLPDLLADEGSEVSSDSEAQGQGQGMDGSVPAPDEAFSLDTEDLFDFEQSPEEQANQARKEAFDRALNQLMPLKPHEIRKLLEHFDRTKESVAVPVYPNPKPEVAVKTLSLDPGSKPAVVKVASGHVTTLNILDVSGAPWPIEDISWAGDFDVIESSAAQGSHILRISPSSEFAYGNMSIRLLELKTPVIITLETSRDIVHYRFDAIIPEYGPLGEAPLIEKGLGISAGSEDISHILEGVPSSGARRLEVSGVDGRTSAYAKGGKVYVRTPLTLLSPGWSSSVSSADGMKVYEIDSVSVLLLSDNGQMVRAHLAEKEDMFDE